MKKQKLDDEEEDDIDYAELMGLAEEDMDAPVGVSEGLIPLSLSSDIDCTLTRQDYAESQVVNSIKQMCTILALDLFVEHNEPLRPNEYYFGQYREDAPDEEESDAPTFHLGKQ